MKKENLMKLAENMVEYGRKKGAGQVEVSIGSGNNFEVQIMNQEIEKLNQADSKSISFKVIVDNKVANASSSDFRKDTLNKLMGNAVARAKLTSSDPFSDLPENEPLTVDIESLKLYDENIIELAPEKKIEFAKDIEKIGLTNDKISRSSGSAYGTGIGETILVNSNGFSGSYKYTSVYAGAGFQAGSGDNIVEDYWYESSLSLGKLITAKEIADKAAHRVTRMIGGKKIKSQVVPIVFEQNMTASLLGFLAQCIMGNSIYMHRSYLVDKIGEQIAANNINIIDDGLIPGGLGTQPFDSEGVPTRKTLVIENGVLNNYLLSAYSARKLKMKSTGNASGPNNFYLQEGSHTPKEIIKSVDKGLLLTKTMGQGTMPTTGDMSKGAYGIWIENGELTYPVAEITFSGNLADMLNNIEMIGNDLKFRRSIAGPTIKINNVSISGT
ncbi:TldD/PmbA family protein [Bacteroidota bacterium]